MAKTAIGLFQNSRIAGQVADDLSASGFPRNAVRVLGEPRDLEVSDPTDTPRTDFEVGLGRELKTFGASDAEVAEYVQGIRRGGFLVFATGSAQEVDKALELMNSRGAMEVEEFAGRVPTPESGHGEGLAFAADSGPQTGRVRQSGGGARMFVW